jgi:hypothetical protein
MKLGLLLPRNVQVIVGGRASTAYLPAIEKIGAKMLATLDELDAELSLLRRQPDPR